MDLSITLMLYAAACGFAYRDYAIHNLGEKKRDRVRRVVMVLLIPIGILIVLLLLITSPYYNDTRMRAFAKWKKVWLTKINFFLNTSANFYPA